MIRMALLTSVLKTCFRNHFVNKRTCFHNRFLSSKTMLYELIQSTRIRWWLNCGPYILGVSNIPTLLLTLLTSRHYNFANIRWFSTKLVPIDSSELALSIGTGFIQNKPMLTKLQGLKIKNVNNQVGNP